MMNESTIDKIENDLHDVKNVFSSISLAWNHSGGHDSPEI